MKRIEITSLNKQDSYIEIGYSMYFDIPASLKVNGVVKSNAEQTLKGKGNYSIYDDNGTKYIKYSNVVSPVLPVALNQIKTAAVNQWNNINTQIQNLTLSGYDEVVGLIWDGATWI